MDTIIAKLLLIQKPVNVLRSFHFISDQTFKNHVIQNLKQDPKKHLGVQQVKRIGL